jgi:hypothetical protein
MILTIIPVVRGIGDVSRIAGRAATIMSETALLGHRRQGQMLKGDMRGDNRRKKNNKKKKLLSKERRSR